MTLLTIMDYSGLLQNQEIFDGLVNSLCASTVAVAFGLSGLFFFISLAWNYLNTGVKSLSGLNPESFVNVSEIIRTLVIVACIGMYIPLVKTGVNTIEYINGMTKPTNLVQYVQSARNQQKVDDWLMNPLRQQFDSHLTKIEKLYGKDSEKYKAFAAAVNLTDKAASNIDLNETERDAPTNSFDFSFSLLNFFFENPNGFITIILSAFAAIIRSIISPLIYAVVIGMSKFLIIVGPIAFAFSILPVFRRQIEVWATTLVNALMVFTTLNILEMINVAIVNYMYREPWMVDSTSSLAFSFSTIILSTMAFWLTGKYAGKGDAGRVLTKAIGMMAAAVGVAAGVASGVAGGAAGAAAKGGGGGGMQVAAKAGSAISEDGE